MRIYMDRRVTPPKRVTSPTWGPPTPSKRALSVLKMSATVYERDNCRRTTSGKNVSTPLVVDSCVTHHNAGCILRPLHTYPDIFESTNFSLRIQTFPRPHVSVFNSNAPVNTYPDSLSVRQLICKAIFGSCETFRANLLQ